MSDNLDTLRKRAELPNALHGCTSNPCGSVVCQTARDRDELLSRLEQAEQDRDSSREACKTLAEVLSKHSEWIVEATDSQDLIGEDGDGDWDVVWDRVMELGEDKRKAEQAVARVRELADKGTDALLRMNIRSDGLYLSQAILRALDGES